uniref:Protein FAM33A n=1 Tax=Vombatus ursinus TaxID=29139 RepID=A0A4X2JZW8_VOMUR
MEAMISQMEMMFQKTESNLDYIQHKLEFEMKKSLPKISSGKKNPVRPLKESSVLKSQYKALCAQWKWSKRMREQARSGAVSSD